MKVEAIKKGTKCAALHDIYYCDARDVEDILSYMLEDGLMILDKDELYIPKGTIMTYNGVSDITGVDNFTIGKNEYDLYDIYWGSFLQLR